ncbi:MAG TPA: pyruvate kinase [Bacillota bacterium]|nr:pyruvate kinase [Bacillota bacterium]
MKKTKIVCTMGPASTDPDVLLALINAGMDVARINFSHGTYDDHKRTIELVRRMAEKSGKAIGVLADIQGPKIRLGNLDQPILLNEGEEVHLTVGSHMDKPGYIPVEYPYLLEDIPEGNYVYLFDGLIRLQVEKVESDSLLCKVLCGGELLSRKGVTLPGVSVRLPAITPKDEEDIKFALEQSVDFLALSFVRRPEHILEVRQLLGDTGSDRMIIAKIENEEGFKNRFEILEAADGIMVARGDLGIEVPPEEVPLIQQALIRAANRSGKPVITATEMLESMIRNPRPTRAEVTDVAHAIYDGTDAIMLSAETAVGKYPVPAVEIMSRVAKRIESSLNYDEILSKKRIGSFRTVSDAISHATCQTALDLKAAAILTATQSGSTARMVSKYRPQAPIIASTPSWRVMRQLTLSWGVTPMHVPQSANTDELFDVSVESAVKAGYANPGDLVVITAGVRTGVPGSTNILQVQRVSEE